MIHMIGTDHILTSWKIPHLNNINHKKYQLDQKIIF